MTTNDENRWHTLLGAYRVPYDPRTAIAKLRAGDANAAWSELWDKLHHQGDVDTASYAAVPELVIVYEERSVPHSNAYALIGIIELERGRRRNPEVPSWLAPRYRRALARLAELAVDDLRKTDDPLVARAALAIVAIAKQLRAHARVLLEFDDCEVQEIVETWTHGG